MSTDAQPDEAQPEPTPAPSGDRQGSGAPGGDVRELRLALVCYGGVSLAIYMHGVTKELHKLVLASAAFERNQEHNPFRSGCSEREYWDLLARISAGELGANPPGTRLRVVVDIISGTSAGGINGIFLAKAMAWIARNPFKIKPPLQGDAMCRWLYQALDKMDQSHELDRLPTLIPDDHELELFVPITDFHGYEREIPLQDPRFVRDRTHRHVMRFRHRQPGPSDFGAATNHMLAFAARATSSFPGAFAPISFADYVVAFDGNAALDGVEQFFPLYRLTDGDPANTWFIDGGVLDNFPFGASIDAIAAKPAACEVDRRLVYIEPDPGGQHAVEEAAAKPPGMISTVLAGYAGIPRQEPILDDLQKLARRNEAVLRVRDVIETSFKTVSARVGELLAECLAERALSEEPSAEELAGFRTRVESVALGRADFSAGTYVRLRIRSGHPSRADLDGMKGTLYRHLQAQKAIIESLAADSGFRETLTGMFSAAEIAAALEGDERPVQDFVARHRDRLAAVRGQVQAAIAAALPSIEAALHGDLLAFFAPLDPAVTGALLTRYLGFPFWDVLVFPIEAMSGVAERDHVEVYRMSPLEVGLLTPDPEQRRKKLAGMSLDGAERLVKLLLDLRKEPSTVASGAPASVPPEVPRHRLARECKPVFAAILAEERDALHHAVELVRELDRGVGALPGR